MSEQDKIPTSPDSFKRPVKTVTPGMTMGGMQSGGVAQPVEPKPQYTPQIPPEDLIRRATLKPQK
jgi:hypothetical protein